MDLRIRNRPTNGHQDTATGQERVWSFARLFLSSSLSLFLLLFAIIDAPGAGEQRSYRTNPTLEVVVGSYEVAYETVVHELPHDDSNQLARLDPGTIVHVVDVGEEWLELRSKLGKPPGFIRKDSIIGPEGLRMVIMRPAMVYSRPSQASEKIEYIEPTKRVQVVNVHGNWLEVRSKHGRPSGFISRDDVLAEVKQTKPNPVATHDTSSEKLSPTDTLETALEDATGPQTAEDNRQDQEKGGIYVYRDNQGVLHFSNVPFSNKSVGASDGEQAPQDGWGIGLILLIIVVVVSLTALLGGSKTDSSRSSSYGDSGSSMNTGEEHKADWPWRDSKVIIGQKNVYEKGLFGNSKVGEVKENYFSTGSTIYKEGFFSSEKVGKVETNFWGTPTSVVDKSGEKVGDIKTTWTGRQIIVDEDGNEIGEYKGK